jgi:hypothetical protein
MVLKTIQSSDVKEYDEALRSVKEGDFVYVMCVNCPSVADSVDLIEYKSHEDHADVKEIYVYGARVGRHLSHPSPLTLIGFKWTGAADVDLPFRICANTKMMIGLNEEVKQAFVDDYKTAIAQEKAKIDQTAREALRTLEDVFGA